MRQSLLFTKTRKEPPKDEVAKSAQFLIRAGFIAKEMAGVYDLLPLGLRVMNNIANIIRREIRAIGGQEVQLTSLQDPAIWQASNRWDDQQVDIWFKTKLKNDSELGLALTHEEPLARLMKEFVSSYRDLPKYVYQIQTKFRNELRAKSGLLRGREFLMKDLYSFTTSAAGLDEFYEQAAQAYARIYQAVGLGDRTFKTFASGGVFSKYSHEFQTLCETGEDTIFLSRQKQVAINKEVLEDSVLAELGVKRSELEEVKAIEVGNIFKLGTKYAEALGLTYVDEHGQQHPVVMGSYGIGLGRLMATVVEVMADEKGLVWPESISPFDVHLVEINPGGDTDIAAAAEKLSRELRDGWVSVLHDDRDLSAGQKFADSDLIGISTRIIVSDKTLKAKKWEVKNRATGEIEHIANAALVKRLTECEDCE